MIANFIFFTNTLPYLAKEVILSYSHYLSFIFSPSVHFQGFILWVEREVQGVLLLSRCGDKLVGKLLLSLTFNSSSTPL